jgi:hypothetical protein
MHIHLFFARDGSFITTEKGESLTKRAEEAKLGQ